MEEVKGALVIELSDEEIDFHLRSFQNEIDKANKTAKHFQGLKNLLLVEKDKRSKGNLDLAIILQEFEETLTRYYSIEGFTHINIYEAFRPAWDIFEKLLYEGVEEENEKI